MPPLDQNPNGGHSGPLVYPHAPSPVISDHDLPPLEELAVEAPYHHSRGLQPHHIGGEKEKSRKKRSRQSLPAYFSNLVMGPINGGKVPSTAVSSGTPSPDGHRIRHMRSKSAIRATSRSRNTSAIKLSTSASTYKQQHGTATASALSSRSNSAASLTIRVKQRPNPAPNTSTTCPLLKPAGNARGRDYREREKARGRSRGILASEAVVYPITATRHSSSATEDASPTSPVASFAEKHIRFIQGGASGGNSVKRLSGFLRHHVKSPPPSRMSDGTAPLSAGVVEGESLFRATYTNSLLRAQGGGVALQTSPTKSRRYSSPATATAPVPISLMMSPARPASPKGPGLRRRSSPRLIPMVRRGWSPMRGRGAVFASEDDEDADEEEVDEEGEVEEVPRGRSRSRLRSRSRARSRSHERERRRVSQRPMAGY